MIRPENMSRTLALVALFCLLPGLAFANAGKIIFAQGEVVVVDSEGERAPVDIGHELEEGDRIKTGAEARTQIRLSDGALISLRGNSDYQIVAQKTEQGLMEQAGKLFSGWMRTVTGAIGEENPDAVEQETPVATIGIRGTTYQVIHMPEGGLPGVPESEPGTYIYLQQGRIESTAGGESRFMEPGDVVFVPVKGGAPVPAPNKKSLFSGSKGKDLDPDEGDLLETPGADNDGDKDRDNLESTDAINDDIDQFILDAQDPSQLKPDFSDAQNLGLVIGEMDGLYRPQTIHGSGGNLSFSGTGNDRVLTQATYQDDLSQTWTVSANTGATPQSSGYHALPDQGGAIIWGVYAEGDYAITQNPDRLVSAGPWQYLSASDVLTESELNNMSGLSGTLTYNYVGGTQALGQYGVSVDFTTNSSIAVDFGAMSMNFDLETTNNDNYTGSGLVSDFYNSGINVSSTNDNALASGYFVGKGGEGIIAEIENLNTGDSFGTATAAFSR